MRRNVWLGRRSEHRRGDTMRLIAEGLSCTRGSRLLFQDLGFSLDQGQALVVTGPNGTGKSSLLRLLAGLATLQAGTVRLEGGLPDVPLGEQAHYLGHLDAHKAALSVAENLTFWRTVLGSPALSVDEALAEVGLAALARLPVAVLSAGQKRRLALARLIVARRPLWLLDEPTTALDIERAGARERARARSSRLRRPDRRRHPCPARFRRGAGTAPRHAHHRERGMTASFLALVRRDLALALRAGGGAGLGVVFFLAVVVVTPFAIGPDLVLLARIGPAILWIGALLACLIGLDRLFAADAEDGSLDLIFMLELPVELAAAAKGLAHWLATGLPLVVAAPILALLLNLEPAATGAVTLDPAGGHPGGDLPRPGRRRLRQRLPPRRTAGRRAGAAAHHPGADLRRRRHLGGGDRAGAVRHALPDAGRPVGRRHRARPGRRRRGAARRHRGLSRLHTGHQSLGPALVQQCAAAFANALACQKFT